MLLTALLGVDQRVAPIDQPVNNYRDSSSTVLRFFEEPGWNEVPRVIDDVIDDIRGFLPLDELPETNTDELLPAVAPGMNSLTEAMSRFGELFGELLLPVVEESADNPAAPSDDSTPDDRDEQERTERETAPPDPVPVSAGDDSDAQTSIPPDSGTTVVTENAPVPKS